MPNVDEHTMDLLLKWVYRGLEATSPLPEATALLDAAHKYQAYHCIKKSGSFRQGRGGKPP